MYFEVERINSYEMKSKQFVFIQLNLFYFLISFTEFSIHTMIHVHTFIKGERMIVDIKILSPVGCRFFFNHSAEISSSLDDGKGEILLKFYYIYSCLVHYSKFIFCYIISSVESQKGVIADQRCSVENQKGAIATDFVQR